MLVALSQAAADGWAQPGGDGSGRALLAMVIVLGLVGLLAWLVRRGTLPLGLAGRAGAARVESAIGLGERRSLIVVSIEGRRLLLGATPTQLTLITELTANAAFSQALDAASGAGVEDPRR